MQAGGVISNKRGMKNDTFTRSIWSVSVCSSAVSLVLVGTAAYVQLQQFV